MLDFLAPIKGFGVTFHEMFRKVDTVMYPEEKRPTAPRFHGHHQLNRWPDGLEKCIGCELCAWACPADAIYVEGRDNTPEERYSPGERYGHVYQINYLRCILCGMCIEACPTRALTMTNEYELADDSRENLIWTKEQLLLPLQWGMEAPPHPMRLGDDEKDYYRLGAAEAAGNGDSVGDEDDPTARALRLYSRLIEPGLREFDRTLNLPDTSTGVGELSEKLNELFAAAPASKAVMIKVGGKDVGVSTPAAVKRAAGYAGADPGFGSAQRAELPGRSTGYRAIVFGCESCNAKAYRAFYDARDIPECLLPRHGKMGLVR